MDLFLILQDLHSFRSQRSTDLIPEALSDFKPHFKVLSRCCLQSPKRHAESDLSSFPFSKVPQGSIITVQIRIKRARAQDATLERKRERERQKYFCKSVEANANSFSRLTSSRISSKCIRNLLTKGFADPQKAELKRISFMGHILLNLYIKC